MRNAMRSLALVTALALFGCPSPQGGGGTAGTGDGGSGGREAVGASDSLQVEKIPAGTQTPEPVAARDGGRENERAIAEMREHSAESLGVDPYHFGYMSGYLTVNVIRANGDQEHVGTFNLVVTAGLEFIVDAFQNTTEVETFIYHAIGTGTTSPVVGNTALETEDLVGNADRCNGSQAENGTTTYRTQCTITKTDAGTDAITEAGLLSADAGGTLLARQTFAAVNLNQNDSIQTTWDITFSLPLPVPVPN